MSSTCPQPCGWFSRRSVHPSIKVLITLRRNRRKRTAFSESSTGMSTLVDNSTVVIYENPCETVENQVNKGLRRDPLGYLLVLCTGSSTGCGECGQFHTVLVGELYGNRRRNHPQVSTAEEHRSSTNYTVDTQFSVDNFDKGPWPINRRLALTFARSGGTQAS